MREQGYWDRRKEQGEGEERRKDTERGDKVEEENLWGGRELVGREKNRENELTESGRWKRRVGRQKKGGGFGAGGKSNGWKG